MPYFSIETNQSLTETQTKEAMQKATPFIADLMGKPEAYVMVSIKPSTPLTFAGSDGPAAFARLKSIGLPTDRCPILADKICTFLDQTIGVSKDRVFIEFKDLERSLFGWNGKTF